MRSGEPGGIPYARWYLSGRIDSNRVVTKQADFRGRTIQEKVSFAVTTGRIFATEKKSKDV